MVADHFLDDEAQKLFAEFGIEACVLSQPPQPRDLALFAARVARRQMVLRFVGPHRLGNAEALSQNVDHGRVDIVDALAITCQNRILAHVPLPVQSASPKVPFGPLAKLASCQAVVGRPSELAMTATIHPIPRRAEPSLQPLMALVADDMNSVNEVILGRMQSRIPLIPALAGHLIAGGGKRMRPMLTLASASLLGYGGSRHYKLAATVEFIHTATLLHDDVVDGSGMRRGKKAANIVYGNPATVLVGDFLFSRAFELMVEDGSLKVLRILSGASAVIAEGEVDQLVAQRQVDTSEERYLSIINAKTAVLFAAACRIAGVVAERDDADDRALDSYGRNLGIAFQLADDAIDYDSDASEMGKDQGDDFREGKMTLPVILAYARGSNEERQFWQEAISGDRTSDADLAHAISLIGKHEAVNATRERARHYAQRAIDAIAAFPASAAKAAMAEAAEFAVARRY